MRIGPIAHGILLVAALVFAYQTWTRDKEDDKGTGEHVMWSKSPSDIKSVVFDSERKTVRIDRRADDSGEYLWGSVVRSRPAPKKPELKPEEKADEPAPGDESGAEGADKPAEEGADEPAAEEEPEMITTTREFPVGKDGEELVDNLAAMRALRDLGSLSEERKEEYGLHESKDNLTIIFADGKQRNLVVGKRVYGGSDRYVVDSDSGKAYVISNKLMRPLDGAETALGLKEVHAYPSADIASTQIKTAKSEKKVIKAEVEDEEKGGTREVWAYDDNPTEPDLTVANFLDRVGKLKPTEYDGDLDPATLVHLATLRDFGKTGTELGYLEIYRQLPEAQKDDEDEEGAPPGRPKRTQYWIRTERTRVLGKVSRLSAERVDQDLVELYGIDPPPAAPEEDTPPPMPGMGDPHGQGAPPPMDPHGHGAPTPPGPGPAMGAPGASPVPPAVRPSPKPPVAPGAGKPATPGADKPATPSPKPATPAP